jgi:hypothetical protein
MKLVMYGLLVVAAVALLVFGTPAALTPLRTPPATLAVNIADIPGQTPATVLVMGPNDFRMDITENSVLTDLEPGTYTAMATAGESSFGTWLARPASEVATLNGGQHATMTFAFTLQQTATPTSTRGNPASFAFVAGTPEEPVRWNPCRTLTWGSTSQLPQSEVFALEQAFATTSRATGIAFEQSPVGMKPDIDVSVSLVPGSRVDGEGTMEYIPPYGPVRGRAISGKISAQIGAETAPELRQALYLHEIGHVMGLAHVSDPAQVMYDTVDFSDGYGFGAGDLAGLRQLGTEAGCLNPPPPVRDLKVSEKDDTYELTWFQPSADPPVSATVLRLRSIGDDLLIYPDLVWDEKALTTGAGEMRGIVEIPDAVCQPDLRLELVASNAYGETVTTVRPPNCTNRA